MSEAKDWNKIFAEQLAARNLERAQRLAEAKTAAKGTDKEPFSARKFKKLYEKLNPDDVDKFTPWDTLIEESEYDYYVTNADKLSLEEFVKHLKWLQGFG
jgi:hypothetical protein